MRLVERQTTFDSQDPPLVIVRKRSCPAVSQICSLTHLSFNSSVLILKSILHGREAFVQARDLMRTTREDNHYYGLPNRRDEARRERVF